MKISLRWGAKLSLPRVIPNCSCSSSILRESISDIWWECFWNTFQLRRCRHIDLGRYRSRARWRYYFSRLNWKRLCIFIKKKWAGRRKSGHPYRDYCWWINGRRKWAQLSRKQHNLLSPWSPRSYTILKQLQYQTEQTLGFRLKRKKQLSILMLYHFINM